jgi:hypothetical protein
MSINPPAIGMPDRAFHIAFVVELNKCVTPTLPFTILYNSYLTNVSKLPAGP